MQERKTPKDKMDGIIVFSDVHYAAIWNDIDNLIGNKAHVLNPTDNHQNNWDAFNRVVSHIKKPYFEIPGNHDYRKLAYNLNFWGLEHLNISDAIRKKFENILGHHKFRWLKEFSSISVNETKFNPLKKFHGFKAPAEKDFGYLHCIFLNTGSNAFVRSGNLYKYLKKLILDRDFIKALCRKKWRGSITCDNDGLKDEALKFIKEKLKKNAKDICFFMHTPIINPRTSYIGGKYKLEIDDFFNSITKQNVAHEIALNGSGEFIRMLTDKNHRKNNFSIVASHIHNAKYFLIHKESLIAKEVTLNELNSEKNNPIYIKHLTTLSLGAIDQRSTDRKTGYLKITRSGFEEIIMHRF
jgi:hypothetical protein